MQLISELGVVAFEQQHLGKILARCLDVTDMADRYASYLSGHALVRRGCEEKLILISAV